MVVVVVIVLVEGAHRWQQLPFLLDIFDLWRKGRWQRKGQRKGRKGQEGKGHRADSGRRSFSAMLCWIWGPSRLHCHLSSSFIHDSSRNWHCGSTKRSSKRWQYWYLHMNPRLFSTFAPTQRVPCTFIFTHVLRITASFQTGTHAFAARARAKARNKKATWPKPSFVLLRFRKVLFSQFAPESCVSYHLFDFKKIIVFKANETN